MASEPQTMPQPEGPAAPPSVEMPRPTAAPLVLALGLTLLAAGVAFGAAFFVVGALVVIIALSIWIAQLLPGRGHAPEALAEPARPRPPAGARGGVEHLRPGMPGYRLRLPQDVRPVSAGLKGGLVGAVAMLVPALLWGLLSGHGLLYPINLLAGMVLPLPADLSAEQIDQFLKDFHASFLLFAVVIHVVMSAVIGIIYGVLLPTLPEVPRPIAWGGLLMPILWTAVSYVAMRVTNPVLPAKVSWPSFIVSQLVFGITMPAVVLGAKRLTPSPPLLSPEGRGEQMEPLAPRGRGVGVGGVLAGVVGGLVGGVVMALPAVLWAAASGRGFWYPVNLLAGMILPEPGHLEGAALGTFHASWFLPAAVVHAVVSIAFGVLFALMTPRLPSMPGPVAWGGLILPLVWTGVSYGLMGVVNPVLQDRVDWAWFIVSQFVFGVAAALVVLRSELVPIPPAGRGPDRVADFVAGQEERQGDRETRRQGEQP